MDVGTDLFVMMQAGASMQEFRVGIAEYLMTGETIIDITSGEAIRGTIIIYLMVILIETGGPGTTQVIGINRNIENLHIAMMGRNTLDSVRIEGVAKVKVLRAPDRVMLTKVPHKQTLTKPPPVPDRVKSTRIPPKEI